MYSVMTISRWIGGVIVLIIAHVGLAAAPIVNAVATPPPTQRYTDASNIMPELNSQLTLLTQIEQLQKEVQQLRGMLEIQQHELQLLQQRQVTLSQQLNQRLMQPNATTSKKTTAATVTKDVVLDVNLTK